MRVKKFFCFDKSHIATKKISVKKGYNCHSDKEPRNIKIYHKNQGYTSVDKFAVFALI